MKFKKEKNIIFTYINNLAFLQFFLNNIDFIVNSLSQNSLAKDTYKNLREKILKKKKNFDIL